MYSLLLLLWNIHIFLRIDFVLSMNGERKQEDLSNQYLTRDLVRNNSMYSFLTTCLSQLASVRARVNTGGGIENLIVQGAVLVDVGDGDESTTELQGLLNDISGP